MSVKSIKLKDVKTENILGGPIKPIVNFNTVGAKNLVFAVGVFNSGEGLSPHVHPHSEEVYYVVQGKGTVQVGAEKKEMVIEPEMTVYIPPGTLHSVKNTGNERLLIAFFVAPPE